MFTDRPRVSATLIGALLALASQARAQVTDPGKSIDSRYQAQAGGLSQQTPVEQSILTGNGDLLVLQMTPLFTIQGGLTGSCTSNAALSPDDPRSDEVATANISLRVGTRIYGKVDLFASAGLVAARYASLSTLNYSALNGAVGASTSFGPVNVFASYQPAVVYTGDFKTRQLTQNRFQVAASIPFRIGKLTIEPSINAERVLADPSDYRNWAVGADIALSYPLPIKAPVRLFVTGGYQWRSYDSYFPDLVGVDRADDLIQASAGLQWQIGPNLAASLEYSYRHNHSTSDVNGYQEHSGVAGISLSKKF